MFLNTTPTYFVFFAEYSGYIIINLIFDAFENLQFLQVFWIFLLLCHLKFCHGGNSIKKGCIPVLGVSDRVDVWVVDTVALGEESGQGGEVWVDEMGSIELANQGHDCIGHPGH